MASIEPLDEVGFLRELKARLARIYHDTNNPLAIASGNIQFVTELVRAGEIDGVEEALADVSAAMTQMEDRMQDLQALRALMEERLESLPDRRVE